MPKPDDRDLMHIQVRVPIPMVDAVDAIADKRANEGATRSSVLREFIAAGVARDKDAKRKRAEGARVRKAG